MRGLNHQVALDLTEGRAEIPGNLKPPAYGVVLMDEDTVIVHMHDFMDGSPAFSLHSPEGVAPVRYQLDMVHAGFEDL